MDMATPGLQPQRHLDKGVRQTLQDKIWPGTQDPAPDPGHPTPEAPEGDWFQGQ